MGSEEPRQRGVSVMGVILGSRRYNDEKRVVVELLLNPEEFRQLQGEMDDVYLFSEKVANVPTRLSLRGRNEVTKYFLIPRQLRKKLEISGEISCQRLDCDGKSVFIYVLDPCKQGRHARLCIS
jgi:hypothetical protein